MVKRRRERDRPKAGPESLYNPNKRVLLSYESDEDDVEVEQHATMSTSPAVVEEVSCSLENAPVDPDDKEVEEIVDGVSEHGDDIESLEEEQHAEDAEVTAGKVSSRRRRNPLRNNTTGQFAAIGLWSYQWEDGEYEEDGEEEEIDREEAEAMAYLRAVRSERQRMPEVFTAPKTFSHEAIYENGIGDTRGYLEDGAYIARASLGPVLPDAAKITAEPQEAFTAALKKRFLGQRDNMHLSPTADAIAALDEEHPISFPQESTKAHSEWNRLLHKTVPQLSQIRAMEHEDVSNLLELIRKRHLVRGQEICVNTSSWIWALLSRLDDVGTMNSDQVWSIRELAKQAVLVQLSFFDPVAAEQLERSAVVESDGNSNASSKPTREMEANTAALEATENAVCVSTGSVFNSPPDDVKETSDSPGRDNTLATLDSIIVVVGEVFGQRDLLEFRQSWSPESTD